MLRSITIENLAIIERIQLDLEPHFNVITGETGSGKSLIVKALELLTGHKAQADLIGSNGPVAIIAGLFDISARPDVHQRLKELSLDNSELPQELLVRREIYPDRSRVFINDRPVTLQTLKNLMNPIFELTQNPSPLIEVTGQLENKNLLNPQVQMDMLDHAGRLSALHQEYSTLFKELQAIENKLSDLKETHRNHQQQLDFLRFQLNEIESFELNPIQDASLEEELANLKKQMRWQQFHQLAQECLSEGDEALLPKVQWLRSQVHQIQRQNQETEPFWLEWTAKLNEVQTLLSDLSYQLDTRGVEFENLQARWDEKSERLHRLRQLQKKYGSSIDDILKYQAEVKHKIQELENIEEHQKKLEEQKNLLKKKLMELAESLHQKRQQIIKQLVPDINKQLQDLNMKGVRFSIELEREPKLGPKGHSKVQFCIQNPNQEKPLPIERQASGGELSRILLAIKVVLHQEQFPKTYLFDEVDAGVSGPTAVKVGQKLRDVSRGCGQVIGVTHLPQVAAFADHHFLVDKHYSPEAGELYVTAKKLSDKERVKELARLVSGQKVTAASIQNAQELLNLAHDL